MVRVRRANTGAILAAALALGMTACGGYNSNSRGSSSTTPTGSATKRVYITVQAVSLGFASGQILILNALTDVPVQNIFVGGTPAFMVMTPDKKKTLIVDRSEESCRERV